MLCGVLVELADCLSKRINLLSVGKYSSVGCPFFPVSLLLLVPLILCLQPPKPPFCPVPHPLPCSLQVI